MSAWNYFFIDYKYKLYCTGIRVELRVACPRLDEALFFFQGLRSLRVRAFYFPATAFAAEKYFLDFDSQCA